MELGLTDNPTDLAELEIPPTIKLDFPDPADILNFNVTIQPDEGDTMRACLPRERERV